MTVRGAASLSADQAGAPTAATSGSVNVTRGIAETSTRLRTPRTASDRDEQGIERQRSLAGAVVDDELAGSARPAVGRDRRSYEVAWLLGRTYPEPLAVLAFRLFSDTDLAMRPQALAVAVLTVAVAAAALVAGAALLRRVAVLR